MYKRRISSAKILLLDIGNTSTCLATAGIGISRISRIDTATSTPRAIRGILLEKAGGTGFVDCVISSVVPRLNRPWIQEISKITGKKPLYVDHRLELGVKLKYPKPASIGHDRLANAAGAVAGYGTPVLVADFGTATTFDIIDAKGVFLGGVIAPGLRLMTDYMAERTALLPRIRTDGVVAKIGRSTKQAMKIGAIIGYRGLVKEITQYLVRNSKIRNLLFVATGGLAPTALNGIDIPYIVDQSLTMDGLRMIYKLNRNKKYGGI